jgi:DNA-directed RNA polymerase subunit RPC12/RpoP
MSGVYVYECAACGGRFSLLCLSETIPEAQTCIACHAKGARRIAKEGEQDGPLHIIPKKQPEPIEGEVARSGRPKRLKSARHHS